MNTLNVLLGRIKNAKKLDFGNVLSDCVDLFKKVWLQGLIVLILNAVLMFPLVFICYLPMIALGLLSPESFAEEGVSFSELNSLSAFMLILSIVLVVIVLVASVTLGLGLKAAYFRIVKSKDFKLSESDDYFFFLKKRYLKKTIVLGLMMIGISIVAFLMLIIPLFYVFIPLSYMVVVYAINPDLEVSEIVKVGFKLGNRKWLFTFLLIIVAWILSTVVGFLMCLIGIYVTQQFINLPFYQIYKESVGFEEEHAINETGTPTE
ncbi:hypothetical protein GCM10023311_17190 [Flaviramulus aquimarinus]|uniref:DUF975 family protein n=1 Tax=Flaviramulus aquimarinus TaxID=1170456 RepID=A0ABP9F3M6_9FLAO